jgi:hypothetical protein
MICGPHQLSVFLGASIIWLSLMITLILCGLFLCMLNLKLFPHCQFFAFVFMQFGHTIKAVQCDNGREFDNASSCAFLASSGVILWMFCPHTFPHNGKVECSLHTINNTIRSLLFQASMLNHLPCKAINVSCPYVTLYGVAPSYEHLRMFSCVCYPKLSTQAIHKLPPGPLVVSFSDSPLITKVIDVSISPPTTLLSPNMLFLMRQIFPFLSCPV